MPATVHTTLRLINRARMLPSFRNVSAMWAGSEKAKAHSHGVFTRMSFKTRPCSASAALNQAGCHRARGTQSCRMPLQPHDGRKEHDDSLHEKAEGGSGKA